MPINVHQIQHLIETVQDLGPLHVNNCFFFESLNGIFLRFINGSNRPDIQIVKKFSHFVYIKNAVKTQLTSEQDEEVYRFCNKMISRKKSFKLTKINEDCSRGTIVKSAIPESVLNLLEQNNVQGTKISMFTKLSKAGSMYIVKNRNREVKYNNSYVQYSTGDSLRIGVLQFFIEVVNCACEQNCGCEKQYYAVLENCNVTGIDTLYPEIPPFTFEVLGYTNLQLISIDNLRNVCFLSKVPETDKTFVVVPPHIMHLS